MKNHCFDFEKKFFLAIKNLPFSDLLTEDQEQIKILFEKNRFTFSEMKIFCELAIDLHVWQENSILKLWKEASEQFNEKKMIFSEVRKQYNKIQCSLKSYENFQSTIFPKNRLVKLLDRKRNKKIWGPCPVFSDKTVCCGLDTLDAVKNCGFGCSYCAIQTMFTDEDVQFDVDFSKHLQSVYINADEFYHIGTGQSSDSLMWGNHQSMLTELILFAQNHPNVLLEFKTKSKNIKPLLKHKIPQNVMCSWSLNPDRVISKEEHFTASLDERLCAAKMVSDSGVFLGFHFHPIIWYEHWEKDYVEIVKRVLSDFNPDRVLFISLGTLTFPKPVINKIRSSGISSKILQMPMEENPEGKLTYPESIKHNLFSTVYEAFQPWHDLVFFYLCMEEKKFWKNLFGKVYQNNAEFKNDLARCVTAKIRKEKKIPKQFSSPIKVIS